MSIQTYDLGPGIRRDERIKCTIGGPTLGPFPVKMTRRTHDGVVFRGRGQRKDGAEGAAAKRRGQTAASLTWPRPRNQAWHAFDGVVSLCLLRSGERRLERGLGISTDLDQLARRVATEIDTFRYPGHQPGQLGSVLPPEWFEGRLAEMRNALVPPYALIPTAANGDSRGIPLMAEQ